MKDIIIRRISYNKLRNIVRTGIFPLFTEYELWKYMDNVFYEVRVDKELAAISSYCYKGDEKVLYLSLVEVRPQFRGMNISYILFKKQLEMIVDGWSVYVQCISQYAYRNIMRLVTEYTQYNWIVKTV